MSFGRFIMFCCFILWNMALLQVPWHEPVMTKILSLSSGFIRLIVYQATFCCWLAWNINTKAGHHQKINWFQFDFFSVGKGGDCTTRPELQKIKMIPKKGSYSWRLVALFTHSPMHSLCIEPWPLVLKSHQSTSIVKLIDLFKKSSTDYKEFRRATFRKL